MLLCSVHVNLLICSEMHALFLVLWQKFHSKTCQSCRFWTPFCLFTLAVCQFNSSNFREVSHDHRIWCDNAQWFGWSWPRFSWYAQDSDGHAHDFLGSPQILGGLGSEYIRAEFSHFGTAHCWELSRLHDPRYFPEIKDIIRWEHTLVIDNTGFY